MPNDDRQYSPAAERNAPPLLNELQRLLPAQGLMLEIASGTGQHAAHFSAGLPGWTWQPSDASPEALRSIESWCADHPRVRAPLCLNLLAAEAPAALPTEVDAVFCANLIHIAPWTCTAALMQLASQRLRPGGLLLTYGPYIEDGLPTAASNLAFDADLRGRNAAWGLRRLAEVASEAQRCGLRPHERVQMPANNLLLAWLMPRQR